MYVVKYQYKNSENIYHDEHESLENAYNQYSHYIHGDAYGYCELFKLVPIEVELKAVEKI